MTFLPHDLIQVKDVEKLSNFESLPQWAQNSLEQASFVVVRRGQQSNGLIPVGIRGRLKQQRAASFVGAELVETKMTPFELVQTQKWLKVAATRKELPVFQALREVFPILQEYQWGIGGSCGYELVTGVPMVNLNSDLDIIVKNFPVISLSEARDLLFKLNQFKVHIDMQVTDGQNGFSLEEYANDRSQTTLIKTANGPELTKNPWLAITQK